MNGNRTLRSARFGFRETPKTPETPPVARASRMPLHCTYCGRLTSSWTACDACGGVYCATCAYRPDLGGHDCPDPGCNLHPIR
jgi:hypothetical protein